MRAITRAAAAGRSGFLLADDVGLGKTITAWASVLALPSTRSVLIVCPLAVVAHWRRTLQAMGDGGRRVILLNYERLGKLFEVSPRRVEEIRTKKGLARTGSAEEFDLIVWDESHRCKNPAAARSKLAVKLNARAGLVLWLSATAGQNPLELSYLAPLLANVTGSRAADLKDFEQWCLAQGLGVTRGAYGKWAWRGNPADCERVRALLFDGEPAAGIRRRPEDLRRVAGDQPHPHPHRARSRGPRALRARLDRVPPRARAHPARQGPSLGAGGHAAPSAEKLAPPRPRDRGAGARAARQRAPGRRLRGLPGDPRRRARGAGGRGRPLRADPRRPARRRPGGGAPPLPARREPVVLFTVEEGISLHQGEHNQTPRSEVIHDLRWSAIQMAQIEGRCHRDGRFAQVYWAYADGTLEEQIALVVARRIQSMKGMVGDDVETDREIERLLAGARDGAEAEAPRGG